MKKQVKKKRKNKKEKVNFKDIFSSIIFLKIVFAFLLVLVIVLAFFVYHKRKEDKKELNANMVIPIKEFDANYSFGVEIKPLLGKKYLFKVTNYRNDEVNTEDVYYKITINNETNSIISFTSGDIKKKVSPKEISESDAIKLAKDKEKVDYYYIEVEKPINVKEREKVQITITSQEKEK